MCALRLRDAIPRLTAMAVVAGLLVSACSSSTPQGSPTSDGSAAPSTGVVQPSGGLPVSVDASQLPQPGQTPHYWAGLLHQVIASDPTWQALSGPGVDADLAKVEDELFAQLQPSNAGSGDASTAPSPAPSSGGTVSNGASTFGPADFSDVALVRTADAPALPGLADFIALGATLENGRGALPNLPAEGATGTVQDKVNGVDVSGHMTVTPDGTELSITMSKDGKTYSMTVKESVTGDPCPDSEGQVPGTFEVFFTSSGSTGADSGGGSVAWKGTFTGTVDDNAEISSIVSDGSMIRNQTVDGSVTSDSIGLHTTLDGALNGQNVVTTFRMTNPGQAEADQLAASARDALNGIVAGIMTQRRNVWQGGACVAVTADLPDKVKRNSTTPFTVKVTHKPDGAELNAPVTAKLDSGAVSVSPDRIDKAPGQFTYVAPDAAGKKASLTFTSKSRRGIGTLTKTVSTMRYVANGGNGQVSITGTVDDLDKPFDLKVVSPGGTGTVTMTPTGPTSGKIQGITNLGFSTEVTKGTYTLKETKTGYLATGTVSTCLTKVRTCSSPGSIEVTFTAE